MTPFIPCRKCKETVDPFGIRKPVGFYYELTVEHGRILKECSHHKEWERAVAQEKKFESLGFNSEFFKYDIGKDYRGQKSAVNVARLTKYVSLFNDKQAAEKVKRSILYLHGPNGTQKTTLANWIGKQLLTLGYRPRYVLMKQLVDTLWNSQRNDDAKLTLEDYLERTDVLIIDESFSKDKIHLWSSGFQIGYIDEFLRELINKGIGIIFISNNHPDEIEAQGFSHSIEDLVKRELKKYDSLMVFKDVYFDSISESEIPEKLF